MISSPHDSLFVENAFVSTLHPKPPQQKEAFTFVSSDFLEFLGNKVKPQADMATRNVESWENLPSGTEYKSQRKLI